MYRCNSNILHCNVIDSMTMSRLSIGFMVIMTVVML